MKRLNELKPPFKYDDYGQSILNSENHKVLDVRGWGFIQYLDNAEELQDDFGRLVASLLNDKVKECDQKE